jgi:trehalose 6-phosphate phosphatase
MVDAASLLARLAARPEAAAVLLDVDGTLAPIVALPGEARVPEKTRAEVARLAGRYALVACISGRPGADAAQLVGVDGVRYVGEHGLELEPAAEAWAERLAQFAAGVDWPVEEGKRLSLSFHYRTTPDAEPYLQEVARRAEEVGLRPRWGRKVLEIRPPLETDKGTAVLRLLEQDGLRRALYAGDDVTDLDAFRALKGLDLGVCVAVVSEEAPPDLAREADITVAGPEELAELLRML